MTSTPLLAPPTVTRLPQPQCLEGRGRPSLGHPVTSSPTMSLMTPSSGAALWDGEGDASSGRGSLSAFPSQVQHAGLHVAQGHALRSHRHRLPGAVRGRGLGRPRGAAALHAHRLLRQEALPAQDGEQQTAQDQVSGRGTGLTLTLSPAAPRQPQRFGRSQLPGLDEVLSPRGVIWTPCGGDEALVGGKKVPGGGCPAGTWLVAPALRLIL